MLGRSFFREFDEDPFFANHRRHMQHMQSMMLDPFGMANNMLGFGEPQRQPQRDDRQVARTHRRTDPFGSLFENMFMNTRRMMDDMHRAFEQVETVSQNNGNANIYSQSSFMSYSNTGDGQPKIFQASSSTRQAPGGIKEVRKAVRDSESGIEKMAIGHHIGERGHVIERSRNRRTGDAAENQEFINLEEEEARTFDREWQERTHRLNRGGIEHSRGARHNPLASQRRSTPAILERQRNASHRDRE